MTISLSLLTAPPDATKVANLVYGGMRAAVPRLPWYRSVEFQGACVLAAALALNFIFW